MNGRALGLFIILFCLGDLTLAGWTWDAAAWLGICIAVAAIVVSIFIVLFRKIGSAIVNYVSTFGGLVIFLSIALVTVIS